MANTTASEKMPAPAGNARKMLTMLLLPVALLTVLVAALMLGNPVRDTGAPPVEEIAFERVTLADGQITLVVRNAASTPVTVAQILVDDAYWLFAIDPSPTLDRYQTATIHLNYPWVEGEPILIVILTQTGTPFEHEVAVAIATPTPTPGNLADYAIIGLVVGVLPVAAGMAFFPAMRSLGRRHQNAILALTLGVLGFLAIDTIFEGVELAGELPGALQGVALFVGSALLAMAAVLGLDRYLRGRGAKAVALAVMIAIGIGLHNLGEGLIIGSAFALGSITLGSTLIAGFALHNVTEGPAIVSPLTKNAGLPWKRFLILAALAGLPTVLGAWMGAFASTSILSVVFFGLGAGAILVVLVQVGASMQKAEEGLWTPLNMMAFVVGFLIMLVTALLVAA